MNPKQQQELLEELNRKLGVIIALLAAPPDPTKKITLREQIVLLNNFGLKSSEIAVILNKTTGYVSKELSLSKGGKK